MVEHGAALSPRRFALRRWLRDCAWAALLIALTNLPFWVLELRYVVARPVFNADAAIALLLASAAGAWWVLALAMAWVLDLLQGLAVGFHFGSINNLLQSVRFLPHVDITGFLGPGLMVLVVVLGVCLAAVTWLRRRLQPAFSAVVAVLVVLTLLDVVNGSGLPLLLKKDVHGAVNLQGSPALNVVAATLARTSLEAAPPADPDQRLQRELLDWAGAHRNGSLFFVVLESWGDYADPAVRDAVESALYDPEAVARWQISRRSVAFRGATTAGEIRLLCGSTQHYSQIGATNQACLGVGLKRLGFSTVGLHGFSRFMFDREAWWPRLGLDKTVFEDNLGSAPAPARCGTVLRGICDAHMVDAAANHLGPGRFVYLLTLDTHLPLAAVALTQQETVMCSQRRLSASVCQHAAQMGRLIKKIVAVAATRQPTPLLVLAGDHSPPFFDGKDRSMFSSSQVPLVVAVPR